MIEMFELITEFWGERDERITRYPLMGNVAPTVALSCCYLLFIKVIGPFLMGNRNPFELRTLMVVYNALLVAFNGWLCFNYAYYAWFTRYSWRCENTDPTNSPENLMLILTSYGFYISKFLEFGDSVFFVLRKKYSHLSFLHVFHHSVVPITTWYGISYGPTGYITVCPLFNTFVHVVMYSYYGLSAMGPSMQKYLWWKKYLTSLQMVQFTVIILLFFQLCFFPPQGCRITGFQVVLSLGVSFVFLGLFLHFYFKAYSKKAVVKLH